MVEALIRIEEIGLGVRLNVTSDVTDRGEIAIQCVIDRRAAIRRELKMVNTAIERVARARNELKRFQADDRVGDRSPRNRGVIRQVCGHHWLRIQREERHHDAELEFADVILGQRAMERGADRERGIEVLEHQLATRGVEPPALTGDGQQRARGETFGVPGPRVPPGRDTLCERDMKASGVHVPIIADLGARE